MNDSNIILLHDPRDEDAPGREAAVHAAFERFPHAGACICGIHYIEAEGKSPSPIAPQLTPTGFNFAYPSTWAMKREFWSVDTDPCNETFLNNLLTKTQIIILPDPLVKYHAWKHPEEEDYVKRVQNHQRIVAAYDAIPDKWKTVLQIKGHTKPLYRVLILTNPPPAPRVTLHSFLKRALEEAGHTVVFFPIAYAISKHCQGAYKDRHIPFQIRTLDMLAHFDIVIVPEENFYFDVRKCPPHVTVIAMPMSPGNKTTIPEGATHLMTLSHMKRFFTIFDRENYDLIQQKVNLQWPIDLTSWDATQEKTIPLAFLGRVMNVLEDHPIFRAEHRAKVDCLASLGKAFFKEKDQTYEEYAATLPAWMCFRGDDQSYEEYVATMPKVFANIHFSSPEYGIGQGVPETLACKTLLLEYPNPTAWSKEAGLKHEENCLFFNTPAGLLTLIEWVKHHPAKCDEIRENGYALAQKFHYPHLLESFETLMGGTPAIPRASDQIEMVDQLANNLRLSEARNQLLWNKISKIREMTQ